MYIIYKIVSIIKLSQNLSKKYPKYKFVPVYWMASEDHDFEEIKSFHSNGKTYTWDIKSKGPVGNLNTETLKNILLKIFLFLIFLKMHILPVLHCLKQ